MDKDKWIGEDQAIQAMRAMGLSEEQIRRKLFLGKLIQECCIELLNPDIKESPLLESWFIARGATPEEALQIIKHFMIMMIGAIQSPSVVSMAIMGYFNTFSQRARAFHERDSKIKPPVPEFIMHIKPNLN